MKILTKMAASTDDSSAKWSAGFEGAEEDVGTGMYEGLAIGDLVERYGVKHEITVERAP